MIKQIFNRKPKINVHAAAEAVFDRLFNEEVKNTCRRLRRHLNSGRNDNLRLAVLSLFVFIAEYSTSTIYGRSKTAGKILKAFYSILKNEYDKDYDIIVKQADKLSEVYYSRPEDPLFGLGMYFSKCINPRKEYCNLLIAMTGTTETSKKSRTVMNYYIQINKDFRF
jgi:hypothetical protein